MSRASSALQYLSLEDEAREELQEQAAAQARLREPRPALSSRSAQPSRPGKEEAALALDPAASRLDKLAALRAHLQRVAPAPLQRPGGADPQRLPSGVPDLDQLVGGWPRAGLSEISGPPGSGRLALVLPALRALARGQAPADGAPAQAPRTVAIVDAMGWLYPPGLADLPLDRLLLVRPGTRALWAAEQLARSGALPMVVLLDPAPPGTGARRLLHAAEAGGCCLVVVHEGDPRRPLPAALRLEALGGHRFCLRRGGRPDSPVQAPRRSRCNATLPT